jgi:hypothetical protein
MKITNSLFATRRTSDGPAIRTPRERQTLTPSAGRPDFQESERPQPFPQAGSESVQFRFA